MKVVFLGGASGIGASCVAIQIGERWALVDAGVRMDPQADRLPDLSFLQGKPLAAIFVTHSHADHIGALPLVHQSFPTVPIYASRGTMLLMEVMLSDALQVMAKRATTEFEVPLYDEDLVAATLHCLYPLPMNDTTTVAELPNVTIHTAPAGHVAGAISIGLDTPEGSVIVSGDVSITPQHTVPAAQIPTLRHPDLLILESTYGSRLHPNRQAEEDRLAASVAEGIDRGGHVLIPSFALGRAQEILRILHTAQRRGRIAEFPIWVDGLVRRVCSTYTAIPEALTPNLQRQIQKGYPVFYSGMVRPLNDARHRERILRERPSCIVTSSGMLTGGPSAFYATHLAGNPDASILITGYQDEESPGRRLLALADQKGGTLELNDQSIAVRCHFDRYHLSAHADGDELTAMVSALRPRQVALVHGDLEARTALAQRLERLTEVILTADGQTLTITGKKRKTSRPASPSSATKQPQHTAENAPPDMEKLWKMVAGSGNAHIVSVRELALVWYGTGAGKAEEETMQRTLEHMCREAAPDTLSFIPVPELEGLYRVREPTETDKQETLPDKQSVQPGVLLLLQVYGDKVQPAICYDTRGDAIWAYPPASEGNRTRFPRAAVLDVVGKWKTYPISDVTETRQSLADMVKATHRWQRQHPVRSIIDRMEAGKSYSFQDLATAMEIEPDNLPGRLALALTLNAQPRLFVRQQSYMLANAAGEASYMLNAEWQTALQEGVGEVRPDQMWILSVIEQHIGSPPDLYRKSVNPDTGEVSLAFHFPAVARERYRTQLEAAAEEAGVTVTIAPQPHQGALNNAARAVLPSPLVATKTSIHHDRDVIRLKCSGTASDEDRAAAINRFAEQTGWNLEIETDDQKPRSKAAGAKPGSPPVANKNRLDLHTAMGVVRDALKDDPEFYKISADQGQGVLMMRFHFPEMAETRHATLLANLAEQTGWHITVYPELHQGAMEALVRRLLPAEVEVIGTPSLYRKNRQVTAKIKGQAEREALQAASKTFSATTGWSLVLQEG
jgi:Cft2 family RNA processing exonuclease